MSGQARQALVRPIFDENPIALQILGICSALAVTTSLAPALVMSAAVIVVLTTAGVAISLIRHYLPRNIRIIIQITIIASLVIVVDQVLKAYAWEMSKQLSVFVGLIVTNCIVLGRAEVFASHNPVRESALDGLGNGIGYGLVLVVVGAIRELFGSGTLLGMPVMPVAADGGWFQPLGIMLLPPSAFFIIGFLVWALRSWKREQVEAPEYRVEGVPEAPEAGR